MFSESWHKWYWYDIAIQNFKYGNISLTKSKFECYNKGKGVSLQGWI